MRLSSLVANTVRFALRSAVSFIIPVLTSNYTAIMIGFLVFEGCVGMYFPSMGTLKSKIVPESQVRS